MYVYNLLFVVIVFSYCAKSFNYTSCDHAKQPKFLSSCCDVQKNDKAINSCRKSLLGDNSTNSNGEVRNLKSDKVALHACIAECSFRTNGFLLSSGTVNTQALQKSYQQRYKNDPNMSQLMLKSLNSCTDYARKRVQEFQWMPQKGDCDFYPATLLACVMEKVYINCPTSKWKNTSDCTAMWKYLVACDDVASNKKK
uniref:RT06324p n=1 Tax=Drosophila melanogaster TaxID=7227 RepID=D3PK94_DROME|nr:RT06324p [Drosophila melanogaster]